MPTWLGIQHKAMVFPCFVWTEYSLINFCTRSLSMLKPAIACRLDSESEKITIFSTLTKIAQRLYCAQWTRYCWNRNVFKLRRKVALWRSGFRSASKSEFHVAGAGMAKARRPYVSSWNLRATSKLRLAEQRCCHSARATGMHSADKQSGAWPWRHLYTIQPSLYVTHLPHRAQHEKAVSNCGRISVCCSVHDSLQLVDDKSWVIRPTVYCSSPA